MRSLGLPGLRRPQRQFLRLGRTASSCGRWKDAGRHGGAWPRCRNRQRGETGLLGFPSTGQLGAAGQGVRRPRHHRSFELNAGTTDVDHLLKVKTALPGKIRYWNAPGRCRRSGGRHRRPPARPAPPACGICWLRRPVRRRRLLVARRASGRRSSWRDGSLPGGSRLDRFPGPAGTAASRGWPASARGCCGSSASEHREVLVKVLDGCAINGHCWVLAAATTTSATGCGWPSRRAARCSTLAMAGRLRCRRPRIDLEAFAVRPLSGPLSTSTSVSRQEMGQRRGLEVAGAEQEAVASAVDEGS